MHETPIAVRKDDHVLQVRHAEGADPGDFTAAIVCPYEADGRRCPNSYLQQCQCNEALREDRERFEKLIEALNAAGLLSDQDPDLEVDDWLNGCWLNLDGPDSPPRKVGERGSLLLTVEAHEDCPYTNLEHTQWEGEIHVPNGPCGLREEFMLCRSEHLEYLDIDTSIDADWPVKVGSWSEDGMELELVTERQPSGTPAGAPRINSLWKHRQSGAFGTVIVVNHEKPGGPWVTLAPRNPAPVAFDEPLPEGWPFADTHDRRDGRDLRGLEDAVITVIDLIENWEWLAGPLP